MKIVYIEYDPEHYKTPQGVEAAIKAVIKIGEEEYDFFEWVDVDKSLGVTIAWVHDSHESAWYNEGAEELRDKLDDLDKDEELAREMIHEELNEYLEVYYKAERGRVESI